MLYALRRGRYNTRYALFMLYVHVRYTCTVNRLCSAHYCECMKDVALSWDSLSVKVLQATVCSGREANTLNEMLKDAKAKKQ